MKEGIIGLMWRNWECNGKCNGRVGYWGGNGWFNGEGMSWVSCVAVGYIRRKGCVLF